MKHSYFLDHVSKWWPGAVRATKHPGSKRRQRGESKARRKMARRSRRINRR